MMRIHGQNKRYHHKYIGIGGRLDTIQAAVLLAKLPFYKKELEERNKVAQIYSNSLSDFLKTPVIKSGRLSAWAQYTIRVNNRDKIQALLKAEGIPTAVYYPMSLHLQECFRYLNYQEGDFIASEKASKEVMSIPMNSFLTSHEINYVTSSIQKIVN